MIDSGSLGASTRELLAQVSVSTLTTCLYRAGIRRVCPTGIVALSPNQPRMVGEAFTLRFVPMREDIGGMTSYGTVNVHQSAFEQCPPGGVLVMDTRSELRGCSCGDLLVGWLKARGCAGVVTDGGFRDVTGILALDFPAYQRAGVPAPSFGFLQAIETNVPIGCGDVAVYPGDIIVGDAEGVVVIPASMVEAITKEAVWQTAYDDFVAARVAEGESVIGLYPATDASRRRFDAWNAEAGRV